MTTARVSRRDFWQRLAALTVAPVAASSVLSTWLRAEAPEPIPGELSTRR